MDRSSNRQSPLVMLLCLALVVAACGSEPGVGDLAAGPRPARTADAPGLLVPSPSGEILEPVAPTPATSPLPPTPAPTATPEPSRPATGDAVPVRPAVPERPAPPIPKRWSRARVVLQSACSTPTATVDATGRFHVAASCGTRIRYASSRDGKTWRTATFARPAGHRDVGPQIVVDGTTLYIAFTRVRETDGSCGDDGLKDIGVYYRSRSLPSGGWSKQVRLGAAGDHLHAFRVVDGVMHETYTSRDGRGPLRYGRIARGASLSLEIPGAIETSLRVGDDGSARIAYSTGDTIRYAIVRPDGELSSRTVFKGRDMRLLAPSLNLGPGDRAYLAWTASGLHDGGCADVEEPVAKPGTYFGTDGSGTWRVRRISKVVTPPALTVDVDTGRVYVALSTDSGIRLMTRLASGRWSGTRIARLRQMGDLVLRRDAVTGRLLLVGVRSTGSEATQNVVAMVKS